MSNEPRTSGLAPPERAPRRRALVAAARRVLWEGMRGCLGPWTPMRRLLRRRLGAFLRRSRADHLAALLRCGALAAAVAAALAAPGRAAAQGRELMPVDLENVARGDGGFAIRGEGAPPSQAGQSIAGAGDVNGDGIPDVIVGAVPTLVVFGKPDGAAVDAAEVRAGRGGFAIRGGELYDQVGWSVSGLADLNGDGLAEVIVGAPGVSPGVRYQTGAVHVVFGKKDTQPVELAEIEAGRGGFTIRGSNDYAYAGTSVATAADMNGDGLAEIIIGAPGVDVGVRYQTGETYVVFGKADGAPVELAEIQAGRGGFAIRGGATYDYSGTSVAGTSDLDGDGLPEIVIGAPEADPGGKYDAGETYVVFGKPDGAPVDLNAVRGGLGGFAIRGSANYDHVGSSVSTVSDLNGDGLTEIIAGAPGVKIGVRYETGEIYIVFGKATGAPVQTAEIQASLGGFPIRGAAPYDRSGWSVAGAGDLNGDGLAELLVGAPDADSGGRDDAGEAYVIFGKRDTLPVELTEAQAGRGGFVVRGAAAYAALGSSVAGTADLDGDGLAELLVAAPGAEPGRQYLAGESIVVFGKRDGAPVELAQVEAGQGGFAIRGSGEYSLAEPVVSRAGDVNGDGIPDLLVGASGASIGYNGGAGNSFVVFGKPDGAPITVLDVQAGRGGFAIRGSSPGDLSGASVAAAGDINGDGLSDLIVGAPQAAPGGKSYAGETYVVFGKADGAPVELTEVEAGSGGFAIRGSAASDASGTSVAGAGDLDGDGLPDVLIGAPGAAPGGRSQAGVTYVVFGKRDGTPLELADVLAGRGGFAILGALQDGFSGVSARGAHDLNGDALPDILVAAPVASPGGRLRAGECYVVFGKRDGIPVELTQVQAGQGGFAVRGKAQDELAGASVAIAGDLNGDGLAELLVGAVGASPLGRIGAGEAYLIFGKADGAAVELADIEMGRGGFAIRGNAGSDRAGTSVAGGADDFDGDGIADLLIGAPGASPAGRAAAGESYVVLGKASGEAIDLAELRTLRGGFPVSGYAYGASSGSSVARPGDVNGDGLADLLIAANLDVARYPNLSGVSYVVFVGGRPGFRRGAVRGEGPINIADALRLLNHLFRGEAAPACLDAADADDSGRLDITDAVSILAYLFLGGDPPPSPGPTRCGPDPTRDELDCATLGQGC